MPDRRQMTSLFAPILLATMAFAGGGPTTQPIEAADRKAAETIVRQLDDPDPAIRRVASLRINNLGAGALEPVERAAADQDTSPETRTRLKVALKYLRPRAARERAERARVAWESTAFRAAYRAGGHTNPKWDADAESAIDAYLRLGADPRKAPAAAREAALARFEKAYDAGCDDDMVLSLYGLADASSTGPARMRDDMRRLNVFGRFVHEGNYPAAVKFRAAAQLTAAQDDLSDVLVHMLVWVLPKVAGTSDLPATEIDTLLDWTMTTRFKYLPVQEAWNKLLDALDQLEPGSAFPLLARSRTAQIIAWERRGLQSNDRTMQDFANDMKAALEITQKAYQLDPNDRRVVRWMLTMQWQLAEVSDTKAEFDKWFDLNMAVNPDDRGACEAKVQFLSPKIRGTTEQMIAFGRECLTSENWRGQIPLVVVSAHERVAELSDDRQAYFLQPEVWKDIQEAYEGEVINYPQNMLRRCEYAKYAALCGQWKTANEQLNVVADKPVISVFGSQESYQYLRRKAARLSNEPTTKP